MCLDFFGSSAVDSYVQGNIIYADKYKEVLNNNITKSQNGYVSLERILYFYLIKDKLSFSEIYSDNLNFEIGKMKTIYEACSMQKYTFLSECNTSEIKYTQLQDYQIKPFGAPIEFSKSTITSFFKEERYVYGNFSIHNGWDFAAPAKTNVYASCDGTISQTSFKYQENEIDLKGGEGNYITLTCNIEGDSYTLIYSHLYPNSKLVNVGDKVVAGQAIASVGTTGYSTGNHLDWKVKLNDKYIDGMSLVSFNVENKDENTDNNSGGYIPPYLQ